MSDSKGRRALAGLQRRPEVASIGLSILALGLAWRRFLDGRNSPFTLDIYHNHYPMTRELVRSWSEGRIPLWTDRVYFGFPYFADPQTAAWYPATLLIAVLGHTTVTSPSSFSIRCWRRWARLACCAASAARGRPRRRQDWW